MKVRNMATPKEKEKVKMQKKICSGGWGGGGWGRAELLRKKRFITKWDIFWLWPFNIRYITTEDSSFASLFDNETAKFPKLACSRFISTLMCFCLSVADGSFESCDTVENGYCLVFVVVLAQRPRRCSCLTFFYWWKSSKLKKSSTKKRFTPK